MVGYDDDDVIDINEEDLGDYDDQMDSQFNRRMEDERNDYD
jgi:hypothetical protein